MSSVLATTENETTSLATHFNKLTTENNVLIVSVIVKSNCQVLQFLHQMSHVSALLLDDALLKCVVTEMVLFSVVAFKTLDIHCTHLPIPLFSLGWRIGPTKVSALESRVGWTPARNNERTNDT